MDGHCQLVYYRSIRVRQGLHFQYHYLIATNTRFFSGLLIVQMSLVAPTAPRRPAALVAPPPVPSRALVTVVDEPVYDRSALLRDAFERMTHEYAAMDPRAYERLIAKRTDVSGLQRPPAFEAPPAIEKLEIVEVVRDTGADKAKVADEIFSGVRGRLAVLSDNLTKCRRWLDTVQERYGAQFDKERKYLASVPARLNLNAATREKQSQQLLRRELAVMSAHKVFTAILSEIEERLRSMIVDLDDTFSSQGAVRALDVFADNLDDLYGQVLAQKIVPLYKTLSDERVVAASDVRDLLLGPGWQDAETAARFRQVVGDLPSASSQCTVLDKVFAFYVSTRLLLERWRALETDDDVVEQLDDVIDTVKNHLRNVTSMERKINKLYCKTEGYGSKLACSPRPKRQRATSDEEANDEETPGQ